MGSLTSDNAPAGGHWEIEIRFITLPDEDAEFRERVRQVMSCLDGGQLSHETLVAALSDLMCTYPNISIRQQDGLASFEAVPRTWYVFRDGSAFHHEPDAV